MYDDDDDAMGDAMVGRGQNGRKEVSHVPTGELLPT